MGIKVTLHSTPHMVQCTLLKKSPHCRQKDRTGTVLLPDTFFIFSLDVHLQIDIYGCQMICSLLMFSGALRHICPQGQLRFMVALSPVVLVMGILKQLHETVGAPGSSKDQEEFSLSG